MKNFVDIRRSFGEVIVTACLPSLEDFVKQVSKDDVENVLDHCDTAARAKFYSPALNYSYRFDYNRIFGDLGQRIEREGWLRPRYQWGDVTLCNEETFNVVPFVSRGIGKEQKLKFLGVYSEEDLTRLSKSLKAVIEFARDYRREITIRCEVGDEKEEDSKAIEIQI